MNQRILISTVNGDEHAFSVAYALRHKGVSPVLWYTSDFPSQTVETAEFDVSGAGIALRDINGCLLETELDSLWNRRLGEDLSSLPLDPADVDYARAQCSRFRGGLLHVLSHRVTARGGLCVNPWDYAVRAENKLWQHEVAFQAGLDLPRTLYTNDPARIKRFIDELGGEIVFKPFRSALWYDGARPWGYFTSVIRRDNLVEDPLLRAVPGIYQELVPKAYELRVTIIGRRLFAAKINSQQTADGQLDWRRSYGDLTMEASELAEPLREQCFTLMEKLGIVFGCLDFIVTPEGRHIFLEVNQAGQFLFVEEYSGLPLLDAFCEFLLQGRVDYEWNEGASTVRFMDCRDAIGEWLLSEAKRHVQNPEPRIDEVALRAALKASTAINP